MGILDKNNKTGSAVNKKKIKDNSGSGNDDVKLNLIKNEIVDFFDWKKNIIILLLAICLTTALLSAAYWGISWWGEKEQQNKVEEVVDTDQIVELNREISETQKKVDDIKIFESRMKTAKEMIDSHIYWSDFFDFLQRSTLSDVYYQKFQGGVDGNYTLKAYAKDYEVIDAQVKRFLDNKYVNEVNVSSASADSAEEGEGGKVSFDLNLTIDPSIFINYEKQQY